ncbi:hypothetical protein BDR26DRAFT_489200 [Obelidium mucronatum]|nr:hypothetical protein BDR26DRAFT_489200 [Obelidium mucronatum]
MMIAGSMLWNLIIFYSPLSALAAAVNWTENNVDSNNNQFYNGPRCQLPNLGWNNLKNPDGSLYTASKRPITILYDAWESSMLNSYVGQYLLEGMGYRVQVVTRIQYILGPEFEHNTVDLEMELWPQDFTNFVQLTQTDKVAVSLGASGFVTFC